jgi:hypothetical protein
MEKPKYFHRQEIESFTLSVKVNDLPHTDYTLLTVGEKKEIIVKHDYPNDTIEVVYGS